MGIVAVSVVFGAVIGSFLTVVAHRVPEGTSIVAPGSACPSCGRPLRWRENVPILSWIVLGGRCAGCDAKVSARYPLIEAVTAVTFGLVVAVRGVDAALALQLPFAAVMIVLAVTDLERRIVPNAIVAVAAVYALAAGAVLDPAELPEQAIAGAAAFTALLAVALAYPGGMGMGDVKLAGVMGLYLGLAVVPALLIAFLSGSLVGLGMMARGGVGERKRAVPFVPFLSLGGIVGLLAGADLIDLYTSRFL